MYIYLNTSSSPNKSESESDSYSFPPFREIDYLLYDFIFYYDLGYFYILIIYAPA